MAKRADMGTKKIISLDPTAWVQWAMQRADVSVREVLTTEFQWIGRDTDALIRASSPQDGEFLMVNEVQLRYAALTVPRRVSAYAALAEEKYALPVFPVLVTLLPPAAGVTVADRYEREFMGLLTRRDFRVINMWEVDVELVFAQPLPPLLPFVPLMRGGGNEPAIREALHRLRQDERFQAVESLLAFFASFVLESRLVQQIMRWDMVVLEQSPWYQEIHERGRQQGLAQGREQGREQGLAQGREQGLAQGREQGREQAQLALLQRMLQTRFGTVSPDVVQRLATLGPEARTALVDVVLTAGSLAEVLAQVPAADPTAAEGAPPPHPDA